MSAKPLSRRSIRLFISVGCLAVVAVAAAATQERWLPLLQKAPADAAGEEDEHAGHDDHGAHSEVVSIKLSKNGLKNIGYQPFVVETTFYDRKLTLPAIVVERPGRSQIHITAPLTGVITAIHAVPGESIVAEQPLFAMRLTHEELVVAQRDFLRTVENLDVVNREITRLTSLGEGVIAGRRILEQEYEKQKLEASLHAESQAMLLHGITQEQIDEIRTTHRLFQTITVRAPEHTHEGDHCHDDHLFQIQQLSVALGQQVEVGLELAVLADHCELHIEGLAFEDDAKQIREATKSGRKITARLLGNESSANEIQGLEVLYVADQVDANSRAFKIYLRLPNQVVFEKIRDGKRYAEWRYKPGQRMQIEVPVERWENQLVLPLKALVDEGAEKYVYRQNSDSFEQVAVHLLYRDQRKVVIANNGALYRGDIIAGSGAYEMHLALKNKSGGGIDPHAGHSH